MGSTSLSHFPMLLSRWLICSGLINTQIAVTKNKWLSHVVYGFWWQVIGWIAIFYNFDVRWLAESWVKLSSQRTKFMFLILWLALQTHCVSSMCPKGQCKKYRYTFEITTYDCHPTVSHPLQFKMIMTYDCPPTVSYPLQFEMIMTYDCPPTVSCPLQFLPLG